MSLRRCEWPDGCGTMLAAELARDRRLCSRHRAEAKRQERKGGPLTISQMIAAANRDRPWVARGRGRR